MFQTRFGRPLRFHATRRGVSLAAAVLVAALAWFWPARRNYYSQRADVRSRLDVPYQVGVSDPKRQLDLYLPRRDRPFPIVVFVHGGYWTPLDRRWLQPALGTFGNVGVSLAKRGVAAAIVGYRQYPTIQRADDSLDDIASALRFVRDSCPEWGCGPLFVVGHSAGGHLVSLLALDPRILARHGIDADGIAGFVSIDGIFDLAAALPSFTSEQAAVMRHLFGGNAGGLTSYSPIAYARAEHPRLLFIDSTDDAAVCRDAFQHMRARMTALGSPAQFIELPGLGHNEMIVHVGMKDDPVVPLLLAYMR